MKKTYIMPEALTVVLGSKMQMMTGSMPGNDEVGNGTQYTKEEVDIEDGITDVNVWDEEW